ncbi:uncharacterized protein LOC119576028 [Penaeus monodon]|uniref:uncharacterized protein LOC119576028 n=1 Tax=Penaeus monodon TaxID=6687 RepID=UPI0018A73BC4|nr:uncharacterized protein LOC119576028 [Penaeus monodon]
MEDAEDKVLTIEEEVLQRWKDHLGGLMKVENPREMRGENGVRECQVSGERAICKNKGDAQNCANCRGIKLMSHIRKFERVIHKKSKELLQKFTTDAIFVLRMLMEKYRERQRQPGCMFLELKKRYDKSTKRGSVALHAGVIYTGSVYDIVLCNEGRGEVEYLERWRHALEKRGMKVSKRKSNEKEGDGRVKTQGKEINKVDEFKYLGFNSRL